MEESATRAILNLRFKTAATQSAFDCAVRKEKRFGALLLRARSFNPGNDPEREGLAAREHVREIRIKSRHTGPIFHLTGAPKPSQGLRARRIRADITRM